MDMYTSGYSITHHSLLLCYYSIGLSITVTKSDETTSVNASKGSHSIKSNNNNMN